MDDLAEDVERKRERVTAAVRGRISTTVVSGRLWAIKGAEAGAGTRGELKRGLLMDHSFRVSELHVLVGR